MFVLGYDMFRLLSEHALDDEDEISTEKMKLTELLVKPGPDLVISDEGHLLKNDKTMTNDVLSIVRTNRKIILTGTPLRNNLDEYWVKPHLLGNRFANPITSGQYVNSTQQDIQVMKRRAHVHFPFCGIYILRYSYFVGFHCIRVQ